MQLVTAVMMLTCVVALMLVMGTLLSIGLIGVIVSNYLTIDTGEKCAYTER